MIIILLLISLKHKRLTKKDTSKKKPKKKAKKTKKPQVPQEPVEQSASETQGACAGAEAVVDSTVEEEIVEEVVDETVESDKEEDECTICFEPRNPSYLFFPCGHATFCKDCALRLYQTAEKRCPDCRSPIQGTCRVFQ